jgi:hypothetical protein
LRGAVGAQRAKWENQFLFRVFIRRSTRAALSCAPARNAAEDTEGQLLNVQRGCSGLCPCGNDMRLRFAATIVLSGQRRLVSLKS